MELQDIKRRLVRGAQVVAKHSGSISTIGATFAQLAAKPTVLNILGVASTVAVQTIGKISPPPGLTARAITFKEFALPGLDLVHLMGDFECPPPREFRDGQPDNWTCYDFYGIQVMGRELQNTMHVLRVDPSTDMEMFKRVLRDYIWARCDGKLELSASSKDWGASMRLRKISPGLALPSEAASAVWRRCEPFLRRGKPRSVLIDGPPGMGKTTIIRWLSGQVDGNRLRIPASELGYMRPSTLCDIVAFLLPAVIVIDDFDRVYGSDSLLDFLEEARATFKLLVVSTNSLEKFSAATIRPRRFDYVVPVKSLGDDFVETFLGEGGLWDRLSPEQREAISLWPAASLDEFRDRLLLLDDPVLDDEFKDLAGRLEKRPEPSWMQKLAAMAGAGTTATSD